MQLLPTATESARADVLKLLKRGPVPSQSLMEKMNAKGHARTTVELAKRELKQEGSIVITRPGSRRNPYFVSLAE